MNRKLLGISLAAVFAVSMFAAQGAMATDERARHLSTNTVVEITTVVSDEFLKATITADGPIKKNGQLGAYGYGLFTDGVAGNNVLAITTHMCASDSPFQGNVNSNRCPSPAGLLDLAFTQANDGPVFHAHILDLKVNDGGPTELCNAVPGNIGLEVDVVNSLATNGGLTGVSPDYPIMVEDNVLMIGNVPVDVLNDNTVDTVASFEIFGLATGSALEHLCLTNASFE